MLYLQLTIHKWKATLRATTWGTTIVLKILFILFILYMSGLFLFVGYYLDEILQEVNPNSSSLQLFNSYLLHALAALLAARFFFQEVPLLDSRPYLTLPVRKARLMHYFLQKSFVNAYNWLPLLIIVPFAYKTLFGWEAVAWATMLSCLLLLTDMLTLIVKTQFASNYLPIKLAVAVMAVLLLAVSGILPVDLLSSTLFNAALQWLFISTPLLLLLSVVAYFHTHQVLLEQCYLDTKAVRAKENNLNTTSKLSFLETKGMTALLLLQELRLIGRNKRPRTVVLMGAFFLLYGFILFNHQDLDNKPFTIFFGCFLITMITMTNYGQFAFSWESSYWDGILSRPTDLYKMIKAKVWLLSGFTLVAAVLALPYGLLSTKIFWMIPAVGLYQVGVNVFLILLLSTQNKKRINLAKSAYFNWEGSGGNQFLMILPLLLVPIAFFGPVAYLFSDTAGMLVLAGLGLISLLCYRLWIREIVRTLQSRKYIMAEGFREG